MKSGLALAPTNARFQVGGLSTVQPKGYAFMTVLPAGDGDVRDNNGAQFYDQAVPGPFKSQLYVHYTNHNFFNRQWLYDDSLNYTQPAVIARVEHEHVLTTYGCALFRATLLGHNSTPVSRRDRCRRACMTMQRAPVLSEGRSAHGRQSRGRQHHRQELARAPDQPARPA